MGMATATNLDGPHTVLPVSHPLFGAPVARGLLSHLPHLDMDSTVTIPMAMAFTTLMLLTSLHLPSLHLPSLPLLKLVSVLEVIPVVPLLFPTEALKVFVAKGLPKLKLKLNPDTVTMATPPMVTTATNKHGPQSVFPVSHPNVLAAVASDLLKLNLDTVIMDTPPTVDIMDTPILVESPDILPVPLTPTEVPKVLASKMQ